MLYIHFTQIQDDSKNLIALHNKLNLLLPWLPASRQTALQKIRHVQTKVTSGTGLLLLRLGMHKLGINDFGLSEIIYSGTSKPYCPNRYDFNISHSDYLVVCAISDNAIIGIDTEKVRHIKHEKFNNLLALSSAETAVTNIKDFFDIWTKKEAVIKADGTTSAWDRRKVKISDTKALFKERQWHLNAIELADGYTTNIASSSIISEIDIKLIPITAEKLLEQTPGDEYL